MNTTMFYGHGRKKRAEVALPVEDSEDDLDFSDDDSDVTRMMEQDSKSEHEEEDEAENEDGDSSGCQDENTETGIMSITEGG